MNEPGIMSCIDQIPYDSVNIMQTLGEESICALGRETWNRIVGGIEVPADDMPDERRVRAMRAFLRRYDERVAPGVSRRIFCRVKHGLKHRDFTWAREKFLQYNDIDAFCAAMRRETIAGFTRSAVDGSHYHGQPVDAAVLRFVIDQPHLLYGARDGNRIGGVAIPRQTQQYLAETDPQRKRYYACHCQFAKASILEGEGAVSKTPCHCSLGHTKVFWEAALDAELSGEVESSVLGGGLLCRFIIDLPDEMMRRYVHAQDADEKGRERTW